MVVLSRMEITRTSILSNVTRTLDLPVTQEQLDNYANGALLQNAFPHLSAGDREFIKTGITNEEWDAQFSDEGEGEDEDEQVGGEDRHLDSFWESQNEVHDMGGDW